MAEPYFFGEDNRAPMVAEHQQVTNALQNLKPTTIGTDGMFAIDGDTVEKPGIDKPMRLSGYDTGETTKWIEGELQLGTAGGKTQAEVLARIANEYGLQMLSYTLMRKVIL